MIGRNELTLCRDEMIVALQEYLAKRWPNGTPNVVDVKHARDAETFVIECYDDPA